MEARSLSDLNLLAANPPQYPENPAEEKQDPITLYISRVPGTRDVILSPFKPQLKNVTAEDIASSLYYVHSGASEPDGRAEHGLTRQEDAPQDRRSSPRSVPRKPLPSNARPVTPDSLPKTLCLPQPRSIAASKTGYSQGRRRASSLNQLDQQLKHVQRMPMVDSGIGLSGDSEDLSYPAPATPMFVTKRKPLGPRPLVTEARSRCSESSDLHVPFLLQQPQSRDHPLDANQLGMPTSGVLRNSPSPSRNTGRISSIPTFTLSLIRRDPSTGNQWNVGEISSEKGEPRQENDPDPAKSQAPGLPTQLYPPIHVHIETSGYAKFRNMPMNVSSARGYMSADAVRDTRKKEVRQSFSDSTTFSRKIAMSYSRSWRSNVKEKLQRMEKANWTRKNRSMTQNRLSFTPSVQPSLSWGYLASGTKPRGYFFSSPWGGRCEFHTGNAGRSVRCSHTLHDGEPLAYNPLAAQNMGQGQGPGAQRLLSELRFNLPGSDLFPSEAENDRPLQGSWRHGLHKLLRPGMQDIGAEPWRDPVDGGGSDWEMADPALDLHLGRERAGGGNRGTRAKLGKLIIYHDGLKMLDLIVAANIGVWWTAWERGT